MYLAELMIVNYRCCRKLHITLDNNYPNILIGINDCGKSTILHAIGLLLNPRAKLNFSSDDKKKNDISNTTLDEAELSAFMAEHGLPNLDYTKHQTIFIGKFILETTDVTENNEDSISNHLKWVISKSQDHYLWLAKVFDEETGKSTTYLLTLDTDDPSETYKMTQAQLTKRKNELEITNEEIVNSNKAGRFKNIELITAIFSKSTLHPRWAGYEPDKNFWVEYRYLDWNITLEQLTTFANDVVSKKINFQMDEVIKFAREQAAKAQEIVNLELSDLAKALKNDLQNIKSIQAYINFQVSSNITDLLVEKENSDGAVHLDSQGDGVKRQLWFALLKWNALNAIQDGIEDTKFIWCFDEPETHLYPKAQREFFEIIKRVSLSNAQSVISTHSTVFIDRAKLANINKVDLVNGYTEFSKCANVDDIYHSLQIKNSDFLFYDKFLVIEGDTEQHLIPALYELVYGKSLLSDSIQLINLGGKDKRVQNQKILESIIDGFRKETNSKIIYIFDNDAASLFTPREKEKLSNSFFIGKQDIEDSISSEVWRNAILEMSENQIDISVEEIDEIKNKIPSALEQTISASQKFYPKLRHYVDKKAQDAELDLRHIMPTKGSELGKLLIRHIKDMSHIADLEIPFNKLQE